METKFGPIIVKGLEKNCKVINKFFERPKIDFKIHFLKYNFVHIKKLITHDQILNLLFCHLSRVSIGKSKHDNAGDSDSHYLLALATLGGMT
jgi:hypothetical protein